MRSLLVSILSVALLAGFASAALYTDDFNSYSDGTDLTGGLSVPSWEATNSGPLEKRVGPPWVGQDVAARIGDGYSGSWANVAPHAGEPYATVKVDFYKDGSSWGNTQGAWVFLNAQLVPYVGNYGDEDLYLAKLANFQCRTQMVLTGATYRKVSLSASTWYELKLEADYTTASMVTLTYTLTEIGVGQVGQSTAALTGPDALSGGYAGMYICSYGGWGEIYLDNFSVDYFPEPVTLTVLSIGGILALWRRRR